MWSTIYSHGYARWAAIDVHVPRACTKPGYHAPYRLLHCLRVNLCCGRPGLDNFFAQFGSWTEADGGGGCWLEQFSIFLGAGRWRVFLFLSRVNLVYEADALKRISQFKRMAHVYVHAGVQEPQKINWSEIQHVQTCYLYDNKFFFCLFVCVFSFCCCCHCFRYCWTSRPLPRG